MTLNLVNYLPPTLRENPPEGFQRAQNAFTQRLTTDPSFAAYMKTNQHRFKNLFDDCADFWRHVGLPQQSELRRRISGGVSITMEKTKHDQFSCVFTSTGSTDSSLQGETSLDHIQSLCISVIIGVLATQGPHVCNNLGGLGSLNFEMSSYNGIYAGVRVRGNGVSRVFSYALRN